MIDSQSEMVIQTVRIINFLGDIDIHGVSTTELLHNLVHSVCQCTQNWKKKKGTTLQPMIMLILCCLVKIHVKFYAIFFLSTNGYCCFFANICVNLGELLTKIYLVLPIHAFFGRGNWVLAQNLCCVKKSFFFQV